MPPPEEEISKVAPSWAWNLGVHCRATDPAVNFASEVGDPALRHELIAANLQNSAKVYSALADGANHIAQIYAKKAK